MEMLRPTVWERHSSSVARMKERMALNTSRGCLHQSEGLYRVSLSVEMGWMMDKETPAVQKLRAECCGQRTA